MSRGSGMRVLGVTGGIGSGKSTVARMLARRGARVVDADHVVSELYGPGALARRIAGRFGPAALAPDGSVDREALARVVFDSPEARLDLERLVHPEVREAIRKKLEGWRRQGFDGIAVVDAALLVEAGDAYPLDCLLVVTAPEDVRLARLEARGVPAAEARRRMEAQIRDDVRVAAADRVLVNDGTLEELERAVEALLADLERDDGVRSE